MANTFVRSGRLLGLLLGISGAITSALGLRTLLDTDGMMQSFGVALPEGVDLSLLISVLGAAILSLGLVQILATMWSWNGRAAGRTLGMLCGVTLLLVAVCAWIQAGSMQVLLLDGIRGTALVLVALASKPGAD